MRFRPDILSRHAVPALLAAGRPMTLDWLLDLFRETLAEHGDAAVRRLARLTPFELTQGLVRISDELALYGLTIRLGPGTAQVLVQPPAESGSFCRRIIGDWPVQPDATAPQLEVAAALLHNGPMTSQELMQAFDKDCGYLLGKLHGQGWVERVTDAAGQGRWAVTVAMLNHFGWSTAEEARTELRHIS